jgi:hypothetical protein
MVGGAPGQKMLVSAGSPDHLLELCSVFQTSLCRDTKVLLQLQLPDALAAE